ncbi:hypothetical protein LZ31DRAFT_555373 [Colletotrichum somersetense]|nr:hypothetical protein LZ31DRAFT_555373 [Colletotrichum somersetense]
MLLPESANPLFPIIRLMANTTHPLPDLCPSTSLREDLALVQLPFPPSTRSKDTKEGAKTSGLVETAACHSHAFSSRLTNPGYSVVIDGFCLLWRHSVFVHPSSNPLSATWLNSKDLHSRAPTSRSIHSRASFTNLYSSRERKAHGVPHQILDDMTPAARPWPVSDCSQQAQN